MKFLIYISHSYAVPIGDPLEIELRAKGYKVAWFADHSEGQNSICSKTNSLNNIQQAVDYKPDFVLALTNKVPSFLSGIKVQVFHGFNAQKRPHKTHQFSHFKIRGLFDLYCTQGPATTSYFKELANQHKHFKVVETGWPKMDPLFDANTHKAKTDANKIMITSTFTKSLSLAHNDLFYNKIKELIKKDNCDFIMTMHPKMDNNIVEKWKSLSCKNFKLHQTVDLNPLFLQSKMMISDTTSALQEFLLLKRPIITFNNPNRPNYALNINNVSELENAILNSKKWFQKLEKTIEDEAQNLHPYQDGKSSQRVIQACLDFKYQPSTLTKKPLNLMRKFKLRKQLNYWKL